MAINYVPGDEAILGPAFAQIATRLEDLINPNAKFGRAVQGAIAQNPGLIQEFGNLEAANPGILQSMGLGKLAQASPDANAQFEAQARPDIVAMKQLELKGKTEEIGAKRDEIKLKHTLTKGMVDLLKDPNLDPKARNDILRQGLGLPRTDAATIEAQTVKKNEQVIAQGERAATLETAKLPVELQETALAARALTAATDFLTKGAGPSIDKLFAGEYKPEEIMALRTVPGLWDAMQMQAQQEIAKLQMERRFAGNDDSMERLEKTQAYNLFTRVGVPAPLELYREYMNGDGAVEAKRLLDSNKKEAEMTEREKSLLAIHRGIVSMDNEEKAKQANMVLDNLRSEQMAFQRLAESKKLKGDKAEGPMKMAVQRINVQLKQLAQFSGGDPYTVEYGTVDEGWFGFSDVKGLIFKDPNGEIVPEEQVMSGIPAQKNPPPEKPAVLQSSVPTSGIVDLSSGRRFNVDKVKERLKSLNTVGERQAFAEKVVADSPPKDTATVRKILSAIMADTTKATEKK